MQKLHLRKKENVCIMFICKEYAKIRIFFTKLKERCRRATVEGGEEGEEEGERKKKKKKEEKKKE